MKKTVSADQPDLHVPPQHNEYFRRGCGKEGEMNLVKRSGPLLRDIKAKKKLMEQLLLLRAWRHWKRVGACNR